MRALLALVAPPLLVLALALVRAAPAAPPPPPKTLAPASPAAAPARGLLLLRAACRPQPAARAAFHHAALSRPPPLQHYRLLSYQETCGNSWEEDVARATVETVGAGGGVVSVGWPGARVCALLSAARRVPSPACAAPHARAALLVELAARLRWRRVLLAADEGVGGGGGGGGGGECGATLRAAHRALLLAGLRVRRAPLTHAHTLDLRPHVVVSCVSHPAAPSLAPALLLHFAFTKSNITLDVEDLPFVSHTDNYEVKSNLTNQMDANSSFVDSVYNNNGSYDMLNKQKYLLSIKNIKEAIVVPADSRRGRSGPARLLLGTAPPRPGGGNSSEDLRRQLLYAADNYFFNTINVTYFLYEKFENIKTESWRAIAAFNTITKNNFDEEDWEVTIEITNGSSSWDRLQASHEEEAPGEESPDSVMWGALAAGALAALLLLAGAGAGARAVRGRRGRGRRGDVVLDPADFTFPPDEARRVPEGMETMLSCWLQQLHEFGGPDLERPDLLQPAPPSAPPAHSAPSSTASGSRLALDRRIRYKGDPVQLKYLPLAPGVTTVELRRKSIDVLHLLHSLRHENINPFIGSLCSVRPALVWEGGGRGSLEDVLVADDIRLDWTFRLSLLTDCVRGLRYLHASPLRAHGRLSSRACLVDSRWVLRLSDHGHDAFCRAQGLHAPLPSARDLLWTAPELLRAGAGEGEARGTQPGDVFSFAIIMQEVIVRGEPYCMLALSPEEIVEKLMRPPPLIRPSVSMGAAPPEAVSVMRQCWAEQPDLRPDTDQLHDIFRLLHRGRKINIVDSMFEMLEKYSNNLEELIKERTEQLDMEKKKTEQLLNRMLPRSVAERLVLGLRVEPEEFEEVSIYFSDIVGFTELAARSSPVQVVALLNDLYTTFDAAIQRYRVYKVETIGDAYMVVGGLPARARDHAESVATMALHLLHLAGRFRIRHLPAAPLHLRIGLHSGPCCAGVVGLTMPRYCLFGDTVNTASRMESTGAAWRIQVSAATAGRLQAAGGYRLRSRGLTQVKGKGAMHTYWLLGKDGFDKPLPTPPPLPAEETLVEHEAESETEAKAPEHEALSSDTPPGPSSPPAPPATDKYAWTRSGAMSADNSPPPAPYARYRCRGGARVLRRQWSLERGEAEAEARAGSPPHALQPLPVRPPPPRYKTRPDSEAHLYHIPTSTSFD